MFSWHGNPPYPKYFSPPGNGYISHQTGKGKSSTQNAILGGYVSSLEGRPVDPRHPITYIESMALIWMDSMWWIQISRCTRMGPRKLLDIWMFPYIVSLPRIQLVWYCRVYWGEKSHLQLARPLTWRIKWGITMAGYRPLSRVVSLPNGHAMAEINTDYYGLLTTYWLGWSSKYCRWFFRKIACLATCPAPGCFGLIGSRTHYRSRLG